LPEKMMASWTSDAQPRYEKLVRSFVDKASVIERSHYPEQAELDSKAIDSIVCRAFSFGVQTSEHAHSGTGDDGDSKSSLIPSRMVQSGLAVLDWPGVRRSGSLLRFQKKCVTFRADQIS
jgi:hypothetical protein